MGFINLKNILSYVPLVMIVMTYFILPILYVRKLENLDDCSCVNDWRKNFLKYGGIIFVITIMILHNLGFLNLKKNPTILNTLLIIFIVPMVYFISYQIISLTYLTDLKNCQCAKEESKGIRTLLYTLLMIMVIVHIAIFILGIIAIILKFSGI